MLFTSWYSNCCIAGFQAAFRHPAPLLPAGPDLSFGAPILGHDNSTFSPVAIPAALAPSLSSSTSYLNIIRPCAGPWAGLQPEGALDMCPPLGLGPPSIQSSQAFLDLTHQLLACGHSMVLKSEATARMSDMACQAGIFGAEGPHAAACLTKAPSMLGRVVNWGPATWSWSVLNSLRMAGPLVSWVNRDYIMVVREP